MKNQAMKNQAMKNQAMKNQAMKKLLAIFLFFLVSTSILLTPVLASIDSKQDIDKETKTVSVEQNNSLNDSLNNTLKKGGFPDFRSNMKNSILILKESQKQEFAFPGNYYFQPRTQWADVLEQKIRKDLSFYDVKSQQIKETVSSSALNTTAKLIQSLNPKIVVIALGENDGLYSKSIKDIRMYLSTIIRTAINNKAKVVLVGNRLPIRYGTTYVTEFADMYAKLAKQYNIAYVPEDKFTYTYPMFAYHYSYNPQALNNPLNTNITSQKTADNIWQKVEKFAESDKQAERKVFYMRDFYRFPQISYGR